MVELLSLLLGFGLTWPIGREMIRDLLAPGDAAVPVWLEGSLPLRGRWLRCFLAAPAYAFVFVLIWAGFTGWSFVVLAMVVAILGALV
jgi:hypothetical protein